MSQRTDARGTGDPGRAGGRAADTGGIEDALRNAINSEVALDDGISQCHYGKRGKPAATWR